MIRGRLSNPAARPFIGSFRICAMTLVLSALAAPACKTTQPAAPATVVSKGELYETGNLVYDEYFKTVHELHAAVATGQLEERDARTSLATMLHLLPTAPPEQVLDKLRREADSLEPMQMQIEAGDDEQKRESATVKLLGSRPEERSKNLALVLEATANADLDLARRMGEIPERARRMHSLAKKLLEGVDADFPDETPARRQQIRNEIHASLDVLVLVANEAREVDERVRAFVSGLDEVLKRTEDNEPASGATVQGSNAPPPVPKMPEDFNP